MKRNKKKIVILAIVAVVAALGVLGYLQMRAQIGQMDKTAYDIVAVQRGGVEVKVKGVGIAEPLYDNTVYAGFAGTVLEVFAQDGDTVGAGDVVALFESGALTTQRDTLQKQLDEADSGIMMLRSTAGSKTIAAPVKGTVKAVFGEAGDAVDAVMERYGALAVISPDDMMEAVIPAAGGLAPGDKVTVTVKTKSAAGTVYSVKEGQATVRFADDGFEPGMDAVVTSEQGAALGSGAVAVANPVSVTARGGAIDKVHKKAGGGVSRGGKLFSLEGEILSPTLYAQIQQRQSIRDELDAVLADIESLTVRAVTDGVISGLDLNENQTVQEGMALFSVQSGGQIKIDVPIDELDIANIGLGEEATVSFDALPGQTFTAKVVKINPIGVAQNNVTSFTVTLILGEAPGVMIGMSADVQIISQRAENALLIPVEAIQIVGGEKYVVLEGDIDESLSSTPATHKVETGVTDGVNIEVLRGLSETDRVAVPQVKLLDFQQQMMMNYRGGMGGNMAGGGPRGTAP